MKKVLLLSFGIFLVLLSCRKEDNIKFFSSWRIESYVINNDSVVVNYNKQFSLNFNNDSAFSLVNPSGSCFGAFLKEGRELNFTTDTCTPTYYSDYLSEITKELLTDSIIEYEVNNKRIKLKGAHGTSLLLSPQ